MNTVTHSSILDTLPASYRLDPNSVGEAITQIRYLANYSDSLGVRLLAQGVEWADISARTTGTVSMALRKATPHQAVSLIVAMAEAGLELPAQVPSWLNQNGATLLLSQKD